MSIARTFTSNKLAKTIRNIPHPIIFGIFVIMFAGGIVASNEIKLASMTDAERAAQQQQRAIDARMVRAKAMRDARIQARKAEAEAEEAAAKFIRETRVLHGKCGVAAYEHNVADLRTYLKFCMRAAGEGWVDYDTFTANGNLVGDELYDDEGAPKDKGTT